MHKITESRLRRIILEEIAAMDLPAAAGEGAAASESERLNQKSNVLKKAAALMKAIEAFEDDCPAGCKDSVSAQLDSLKATLTDMGKNPDGYVSSSPRRGLKNEPTGLIAHGEEEEEGGDSEDDDGTGDW